MRPNLSKVFRSNDSYQNQINRYESRLLRIGIGLYTGAALSVGGALVELYTHPALEGDDYRIVGLIGLTAVLGSGAGEFLRVKDEAPERIRKEIDRSWQEIVEAER